MNQSLAIVVAHTVATLPDDVHQRRRVLNAILECIPAGKAPAELRSMLGDLDRHLIAQRQLGLDFSGVRGSSRLGDQPLQRGAGRLGDTTIAKGVRK